MTGDPAYNCRFITDTSLPPQNRTRATRRNPVPAIAVFARAPVAGRAKTRLIPLLGPRGAAELQSALIRDTAGKVDKIATRAARWIFVAGGGVPDFPGRGRWKVATQRGPSLGRRLEAAFGRLLRGHAAAVIIGTDSPLLSPRLIRQALSALRVCDAVLGPCPDGGFYLVGLRHSAPGLFNGVRLNSRHAFLDTKRALLGRGLSCAVLQRVPDIDRPRDFRQIAKQMSRRPAMRAEAPALWRFLNEAGL